ncbi:flagellar hook-associated protein FlgK [Clostridium butanoliproducens]|uniref:flagellar hook-associated protein FlgK n=1 Tax=Clostridium butanoliproducens TaxID=2991837 RepID=UPI0024BA5A46|nr:flagellar hook-associated protein FlgK [Clostridium butanoliproducens]MDU1349514.1 flagellar hook-associated protein FlgK [Clostridium argentinense]
MSGLFGTLNTSKGAMFAQQTSINVTSHNIANAGTEGYSRQQARLVTSRPITLTGPGQIGTGVTVAAIERTRDSFLDFQIRRAVSNKNMEEMKQKYLSEIESIYNEPGDTGISKLLAEFFESWQTLSGSADKEGARTVVAQKAKMLAEELNHVHKQLTDVKTNTQKEIQHSVLEVNSLIDQLNAVNKQIITITVAGNNPNDLLDTRDLLLDKLSTKFGISTNNRNLNGMTLKPEGYDVDLLRNIDSEEIHKFAYISDIKSAKDAKGNVIDGEYTVTYYKNGDVTDPNSEVTVNMKLNEAEYKNLNEGRVLITNENGNLVKDDKTELIPPITDTIECSDIGKSVFKPKSGAINGFQNIQQNTDDYIAKLDVLAKTIALSVNAIHGDVDGNKINFFCIKNIDGTIDDKDATDGSGIGITAGNITINDDILNNVMLINAGVDRNSGSNDGNRALAIAQLRNMAFQVQNVDGNTTLELFKKGNGFGVNQDEVITFTNDPSGMKIEGYFTNTINKLGVDNEDAKRKIANENALLNGLISSRSSISGVNRDEEMVNLIQFQHSFQANAKMISTVDQLLDVVINGLKR